MKRNWIKFATRLTSAKNKQDVQYTTKYTNNGNTIIGQNYLKYRNIVSRMNYIIDFIHFVWSETRYLLLHYRVVTKYISNLTILKFTTILVSKCVRNA